MYYSLKLSLSFSQCNLKRCNGCFVYLQKQSNHVPLTKPFGMMMSKLLENQWPHNGTDDELLHFVSTFKPLVQYFERFCKYSKCFNIVQPSWGFLLFFI